MDPMTSSAIQPQGISAGPLIIFLAIGVLMIASFWKVFTKAGKPGWASIVPIYNVVVLIEITRKPMWWMAMCRPAIAQWSGPMTTPASYLGCYGALPVAANIRSTMPRNGPRG
jgi:hypothetical protein